jgi:pimeloyl-ACP methyl ester carboxylesterase
MMRVPSTDDVSVAVHDLAGPSGPDHPIVLVAHATGFHGRAYLPMAAALAPRFHTFGADLRGHGDTERPPDWAVDWDRYGDDALAVAERIATLPGADGGLIGFGHSMGGAALLMAAHRRPRTFRLLVLFEPIVPPERGDDPRSESPLAGTSRRRRPTFPSIEDAIANYASKPPMDGFDPAALDAYVRYGFEPDAEGVRLKCDREHEARTFEQGGRHRTRELLPEIDEPVVVVAGRIEEAHPSAFAEAIAAELPNGRYVLDEDVDHFGPFTHPKEMAELIAGCVDDLGG